MKPTRILTICSTLFGIAASAGLTGCTTTGTTQTRTSASNVGITWNTTADKPEKNVDLLFVQNSERVIFSDGKMTMRDVNPVTIAFSDRPERMAGHMSTGKFVSLWSMGKDSFLKNPPNATVSILRGDSEVTSLVVELRSPQLSGDDLTYDVQILEGTVPTHSGAASLFIDVIGMPLTPYSYAGAARRAYR